MKKFFSLLLGLLFLAPGTVFAGSQTYSTPGTYSFTVPSYGTLTVQLWGGGGGGGACGVGASPVGSAGGASYFSSVYDSGGSGGGAGAYLDGGDGGVGGSASGGSTNFSGNWGGYSGGTGGGSGGSAPSGGTGGVGGANRTNGSIGGAPGGGGGGSGGCSDSGAYYGGGGGGSGAFSSYTYSSGQLIPGAGVTVVVGSGGAAGSQYYSGGAGANGRVYISWTDAPPTCSTSVSPSAINQGSSSTLSWSSTNATAVYIANVGWVNTSGSTTVAPSQSTNYACYAQGPGGTSDWMSTGTTLTVYASCTLPWGGTITNGQSTTAYQANTVPYGSSCTSQTRSCSNGTLSGSYQYQSCTVASASNCTLDGVTVLHGNSRTFYSVQTAPQGQTCTSGGNSLSRTCDNGTLSGSSSYQYANCSCTPSTVYSCSPQNVIRTTTDSSCAASVTNPFQTCTSPAFCSDGVSSCLYPAPDFGANGHLRASPSLVIPGNSVKLFWSVQNVSSCSVTGTNGDSFSGLSAPSGGQNTSDLFAQTTYTLSCAAQNGSTVTEDVIVNLVPAFQEF